MRDPQRVDEILGLLKEMWEKDPDLRFLQLIYNIQREYSLQNNGAGKVEEVVDSAFSRVGFDHFSVEDDSFIAFLKEKLSNSD